MNVALDARKATKNQVVHCIGVSLLVVYHYECIVYPSQFFDAIMPFRK